MYEETRETGRTAADSTGTSMPREVTGRAVMLDDFAAEQAT
ncbi:hypothetical protein [Saccharopolyspora hirsuta]|nr:hypothetical protein [Saccharopolyspora hirsuta]